MSVIEIRHLKLIKTISETENLTKAAQKLFVTQPALSQQLKDIEEKLETDLFYRTKKKMILTEIGKKMLKTAETVLEELRVAEIEIKKAVHGETGELKIGVHCLLSYKWLPSVLKKYQDLFPKVKIDMSKSISIIKDLTSNQFDFVITAFPIDHKHIVSGPLFEDDIVLISSPGHRVSLKRYTTENDFEGETLISLVEQSKDALYQYYLKPAGIKLEKFITIEQPEAIIELVKSNFGLALFPRWSIKNQLKAGKMKARRVSRKGLRLEWQVLHFKKKLPPFQQEFINLLQSQPLPNVS